MISDTARVAPLSVNAIAHDGDCETHCPPKIAASTSKNPNAEASSTFPGRMRRRYNPIRTAMGIVMAMVKVPHGLDFSALTTTRATAPSRMMMMLITDTYETRPPTFPISVFAISVIDLPSRRTEKRRMTKSCMQPPSTAPAMIQSVPGRYPNCAASTGPTNGPGPAMAAKWCPKTTHLFVGTKSRPLSSRSAGVARSGSMASTLAAMKLL